MYAPEPFDVGRFLQVEIVLGAESITIATTGPIDPGLVLLFDDDSAISAVMCAQV